MSWVCLNMTSYDKYKLTVWQNNRLDQLCNTALLRIKELTRGTRAFLDVLSVSTEEKTGLVDDSNFRLWILDYVIQRSEVLIESTLFKSAIVQDSELAWRLCSLFISSLGERSNNHETHSVPLSMSTPPYTPRNR